MCDFSKRKQQTFFVTLEGSPWRLQVELSRMMFSVLSWMAEGEACRIIISPEDSEHKIV